jgi:hypothetical protein
MPLAETDTLPNNVTVQARAPQFDSLCPAYWGKLQGAWLLLVEVKKPAYLLAHPNKGHGILDYSHVDVKDSRIVIYTHDELVPDTTACGADWLVEANSDCRARLLKIVELAKRVEANEDFFFPYFCSRSIAVVNNVPYLLAAPIDVSTVSDQHVSLEVFRYIDPQYLEFRDVLSPDMSVRPAAEECRRHWRHGLSRIVLEVAYRRPVNNVDDIEEAKLPDSWIGLKDFFERHVAGGDEAIEIDEAYYEMLERELSPVRPTPTADLAGEVEPDEQLDDYAMPPPPVADTDPASPAGVSRTSLIRRVLTALAFLLLGGGAVAAYVYFGMGVNLLDPNQLKRLLESETRLAAKVSELEDHVTRHQIRNLLTRWGNEPQKRAVIAEDLQALDRGNLNLRYLQLLQTEVTDLNHDQILTSCDELATALSAVDRDEISGSDDPTVPAFTLDDLQVLRAHAEQFAQ